MKTEEALKDIEEFVAELERKATFDIEEWAERTSDELNVNSVRCIECGKEKSEAEFVKLFFRKDQGICRKCWFANPDEE